MFALFVLLLHLPNTVEHAANRVFWIFPVRETTFAMGGLALFGTAVRSHWPTTSNRLAAVVRIWTALAILYIGIENILYPQFSPGVPDTTPTAPWSRNRTSLHISLESFNRFRCRNVCQEICGLRRHSSRNADGAAHPCPLCARVLPRAQRFTTGDSD